MPPSLIQNLNAAQFPFMLKKTRWMHIDFIKSLFFRIFGFIRLVCNTDIREMGIMLADLVSACDPSMELY